MSSKTLSISCVIPTFNSAKTIKRCLESIRKQTYPQEIVEIIIADGGSSDDTLDIAKKYDVQIVSISSHLQNAEYNKGIGIAKAKGDLLLMLDHDNVLPHKKWLVNIVHPVIDNSEIVGVDTLYIHYDSSFSLLDRYLALYGSLDPVAYYLGKVDKLPQTIKTYNLYGQAEDCGKYYKVVFDPKYVPTLGSNGFLTRRKVLVKYARIQPSYFFHTDVHVDLIKKGFNTYAFIKDDIIHLTGNMSIVGFLRRRKLFMETYQIKSHKKRRHSVYTSQDKMNLIKFIIFAITIVVPTFDALRGYVKIRDRAWFLHPVLCFAFLMIYGYVVIKSAGVSYARRIF